MALLPYYIGALVLLGSVSVILMISGIGDYTLLTGAVAGTAVYGFWKIGHTFQNGTIGSIPACRTSGYDRTHRITACILNVKFQ